MMRLLFKAVVRPSVPLPLRRRWVRMLLAAVGGPRGIGRTELRAGEVPMLRLRAGADLVGLHRSLAVLAALPAVEGVVLRPDALLDLGEPVWRGAPFTAMLTGRSGLAEVSLPSPLDPVQLLEVVPITATEAAWVRLEGVPALREAWAEAGIDVRDPSRGMARR